MRVGINGMGRIGGWFCARLWVRRSARRTTRSAKNRLDIAHVNEIKGGPETLAHLIAFDSMQGRWRADITGDDAQGGISIDGKCIGVSAHATPEKFPGAISASISSSRPRASS